MRYYGESNVPGAPGNFRTLEYVPARDGIPSFEPMPYYGGGMGVEPLAGGNFMGGEGLQINPEAHKTLKRQQKIYNKGIRTDNPNEREIFLQRTGPQLPLAQAYPGGQALGNAGALGGMMEMAPRFGPRPLNIDINAVDNAVESIGGSANIQLDPNQMLRLGGSFNPSRVDEMGMQTPQGYQLYGAYETPGFGLNVNYRNTGRRSVPTGLGGGFPGEINAGFKGRF